MTTASTMTTAVHETCSQTSNEAYHAAILVGFFRLLASLMLSNLLMRFGDCEI